MNVTLTTTSGTTGDYMVVSICQRCGGPHTIESCPQVKAIEYDEKHRIKRVEFLTPGDYMPSVKPDPFPLEPITVTTSWAKWEPLHYRTYTND